MVPSPLSEIDCSDPMALPSMSSGDSEVLPPNWASPLMSTVRVAVAVPSGVSQLGAMPAEGWKVKEPIDGVPLAGSKLTVALGGVVAGAVAGDGVSAAPFSSRTTTCHWLAVAVLVNA